MESSSSFDRSTFPRKQPAVAPVVAKIRPKKTSKKLSSSSSKYIEYLHSKRHNGGSKSISVTTSSAPFDLSAFQADWTGVALKIIIVVVVVAPKLENIVLVIKPSFSDATLLSLYPANQYSTGTAPLLLEYSQYSLSYLATTK
jgi:hypothetical protein